MESGSSSQQQQPPSPQQQLSSPPAEPTALTKDDPNVGSTSSSYATVVLSLKSQQQPRDPQKNDNNKENIGKDVNNIDASNKQNEVLATVQPNQQPPSNQQPSVTSSDEQGNDDDDLFTPVVSHSRKERRNVRKDKQLKGRPLGGLSSKTRERGRVSKADSREKRDSKKDGRERTEVIGKELATKTESETENTTPKSGNEEDADAEPVKFVEAPIPKVNAWKVSTTFFVVVAVLSIWTNDYHVASHQCANELYGEHVCFVCVCVCNSAKQLIRCYNFITFSMRP